MAIVSGIYVILNRINGKVYLGQSQDISRRWAKHRSELNLNRHHNQHLQSSWNKYGNKAFKFAILERCSTELLDAREQHFLNIYISKGDCYNLASEAGTIRGIKRSPETRQRMSDAQKGHQTSAETRAKIAASNKGKTKGRKQDPDFVKRRVSATQKQWVVIDDSGTQYHVVGLSQFCRDNGLDPCSMMRIAYGQRKTPHRGWLCRHAE